MSVGAKAEVVATLVQAKGELCAMARVVDSEIGAVARAFEVLAGHADTILKLAAAIVGCVENESISSVLPKVQTLGAAARCSIEDTRRVLSAELPRQRAELVRIEADLGNALVVVECSLTQLSRTPVQFKMCVEDIARQIAGVVAAIQAHDITRQQIEHVQEAFVLMAGRMRDAENPENGNTESGTDQELPRVYGGLTIQIYQLR